MKLQGVISPALPRLAMVRLMVEVSPESGSMDCRKLKHGVVKRVIQVLQNKVNYLNLLKIRAYSLCKE
jgi:hypothetical protein